MRQLVTHHGDSGGKSQIGQGLAVLTRRTDGPPGAACFDLVDESSGNLTQGLHGAGEGGRFAFGELAQAGQESVRGDERRGRKQDCVDPIRNAETLHRRDRRIRAHHLDKSAIGCSDRVAVEADLPERCTPPGLGEREDLRFVRIDIHPQRFVHRGRRKDGGRGAGAQVYRPASGQLEILRRDQR
jgi:hypothetical protein